MIEIFTDGSSLGNPGPGGYGAILRSGKHYKELSAGFERTTNNRMELLAVIVALEAIREPGQTVHITSDSKYVVDAVNKKWLFQWEKKGFKEKKNVDLWKRFLKIYHRHHVNFQWIKGHNDHPQNERCDHLAVRAAKGKILLSDSYYEKSQRN